MVGDPLRYDTKIDLSDKNTSTAQQVLLTGRAKKVLEIGPATGCVTEALQQRGCRVTAIEKNPVAAQIARRFCERMIVGDVEEVDFNATFLGEKFDVVVFGDVLEHLVDPEGLLARVRPVLAPKGYVVASIPNMSHMSVRLMLLDGRFSYSQKGLLDDTHLRFFVRSGIEALFERAGYFISAWRRITTDTFLDPLADDRILQESDFPPLLVEALRQDPEAFIYQFVVKAYARRSLKRILPDPSKADSEAMKFGPGLKALWQLDELSTEKDRALAEKDTALAERDALIAQKDAALTDKDQNIVNIEAALAGKRAALADNEEQLGLLQQHHYLVTTSPGFRLLERLRRIVYRLAPPGTRRQGLFIASALGVDKILTQGWWPFLRQLVQVWTWVPLIPALAARAQRVVSLNDQYQLWLKAHALNRARMRGIKRSAARLSYRPKVSIIMPVYNTESTWLREAIDSVRAQLYDNWELCIADDGSTRAGVYELLDDYSRADERIKVTHLRENQGIAAASNAALALATGEFVGFLDHDDELKPDALYEVVRLLNERRDLDFIYSDEDKKELDGHLVEPFFKPDWSPDLLLSVNYVTHFSVFRKALIDQLGGFRAGYDGSQDYDLALRVTEKTDRIAHIAKPLYTWRKVPGSAAASVDAKDYAYRAAKKALADALSRRGGRGQVLDGPFKGWYRVRYKMKGSNPRVTIIIPTKDKVDMLSRCVGSIRRKTGYKNYEILVVDNGSVEESTHKYLKGLAQQPGIRVLDYPQPFNFSGINNFAAQHAQGAHLLFLNNDTEVISEEWLSALLEHSQRPEVGAVGARLLYEDGRLQHGGVILGVGGVAGHAHKLLPKGLDGYFRRAKVIQNFSAVTAACVMIRADLFADLGGFDEEHLAIAFSDVDLCLRIRERGLLVVWTPYAELYHHESTSRGHEDTPEKQRRFGREIKYMKAKWGDTLLNDPYYNPNLTLDREDFSLRL